MILNDSVVRMFTCGKGRESSSKNCQPGACIIKGDVVFFNIFNNSFNLTFSSKQSSTSSLKLIEQFATHLPAYSTYFCVML